MDWNANRDHVLASVGKLQELSADTVKGYLTASGAGRKTGQLDEKTRQLISLAVAVTTRCDGCGVAVAMNAGAALVYSSRALEAFDAATGGGSGPAPAWESPELRLSRSFVTNGRSVPVAPDTRGA